METDIETAKVALEGEGVFVRTQPDGSLFVGSGPQTFGELEVFRENANFYHCTKGWRGVFPAQGIATYEVDAELADLTRLLIRVIRESKTGKSTWAEAFPKVVGNSPRYLHGVS